MKTKETISPFFYLSPLILQTLIWIPTRIVLKTFSRIKIQGMEYTAHLDKGVIFASNHSSELDPILLPSCLPFLSKFMPTFYTSRENKFYARSGIRQKIYGGLLFQLWGAHPVHSGTGDYETALKKHAEILGHKNTIFMFPEGRITRDGNLQEGRGGIAYLAHDMNVPIVPVGISGVYKMSFMDFLSGSRRIIFNVGMPIEPAELFEGIDVEEDEEAYKKAAQKVMTKISELLVK